MYLEDVVVDNPDDFIHDKDCPIKRPVLAIHANIKIVVKSRTVPLILSFGYNVVLY